MKFSKIKNLIVILILLVVVLFFAYWLSDWDSLAKPVVVTESSNLVLTEEQLKQSAEEQKQNINSKVNIPTHHSDIDNKKGAAEFVEREKVLFEKPPEEKRQVTQMPVSDLEIKEFLDSKDLINPDNEFRDLPDLNYDNSMSMKYLQGLYIDKVADITLAMIYKNREGDLDDQTCVRIKKDPIYRFNKRELEIRSTNTGYTVIMLGDEWYLRLFVSSAAGIVTGKLFQRMTDGWQFVDSIVVSPRRPLFHKIASNASVCTLTAIDYN